MAEQKEFTEVEFVTSLALSVPNGESVDHLQITFVRGKEDGHYRCYFDVVDPSKIKLAE